MSHSLLSPHANPRFGFKQFQLEDYARAALHDGLIFAHDTGLGKTLALYIWPALKTGFQTTFAPGEERGLRPLAPILLVVPGDLHQRTIEEGRKMFKATVTIIDSQEKFLRLSTLNPLTGQRELPSGYYMTSYTQLTGNGVTPYPAFQPDNIIGMMQILGLTDADASAWFDTRETLFERHYQRLAALPTFTLRELEQACFAAQQTASCDEEKAGLMRAFEALAPFHCAVYNPAFSDLPPEQKARVRALMTGDKYSEYAASVGQSRWLASPTTDPSESRPEPHASRLAPFKIKCLYSPSLVDLCADTFLACAIDEGVKMKGEDTVIGLGVRQVTARYKLVLTATPIKNRLPDVFRLAWWATGGRQEAHARFPFPDETAARADFAEQFLISERNLTKEKAAPKRFKKLTPQVCNIHRLWKLFAPVILRRRKADAGEDIVTKTRQVVRAPLGQEQAEVYRFHLNAQYRDKNGGPAIGAQLQALRVAAANSASTLLQRPEHDHKTKGEPRAKNGYIPKLHSALKLIHQCLAAGEQCVLFSAFNDSLDILSARLTEAGIPHCVVDGRTSPKRRGQLAAQFALGPGKSPYPVMLAGVECMSEGHSYPLCANAILLAFSWAHDKFEQAINRIHRLNSRWNVKVWSIVCERSIDRKLESMLQEKGDAAELVLDGKLLGENTDEVNLAELLDIARKEFENGTPLSTIAETELEKEWPPLRIQLAAAQRAWRTAGLALVGVDRQAEVRPIIELPEVTPIVGPVPSPGVPQCPVRVAPSPVPAPLVTRHPSPVTPDRPVRVAARALELVAPDLTPYHGLPLFDLV